MATNKNASIRYRALDKCFRDYRHRYFIEDLIEKCEEELESFNFTANVSPQTNDPPGVRIKLSEDSYYYTNNDIIYFVCVFLSL